MKRGERISCEEVARISQEQPEQALWRERQHLVVVGSGAI